MSFFCLYPDTLRPDHETKCSSLPSPLPSELGNYQVLSKTATTKHTDTQIHTHTNKKNPTLIPLGECHFWEKQRYQRQS